MPISDFTEQRLSLIIRNGTVVDGTGSPPYSADVAVFRDRIVDMGHFPNATADRVIDAAGKVVCPGFIDPHVHSEVLMLQGSHTAGVQMGVTTELLSPDGFSYALLAPDRLAEYRAYLYGIYGDADIAWGWRSFDDYLQAFTGKIYNNVLATVPHGAIHLAVKGWASGPATSDELAAMRRLVSECLEAGSSGISTGLDYVPASQADLHELLDLSRLVAAQGGIYSSHIRGYDNASREKAIGEVLAIARDLDMGVNISHFFGNDEIFAGMDHAHAQGLDISFDAYPYPAGCTLLAFTLPRTLITTSVKDFVDELRKPEVRAVVRAALEEKLPENNPAYFAFVREAQHKSMEGKTVRQAWRDSAPDKPFDQFVCDLLIEEELAPLLIYPWVMSEAEQDSRLKTSITHPLQMFITDGIYVGGSPHPRGWGTYPRVLGEYVRERGWLTLEDAIRRMTGFPAERYGITGRGLLKTNRFADLVIFNPHTIRDRATWENPTLAPEGIEHVFVNGQAVVEQGRLVADSYPGRRLYFRR